MTMTYAARSALLSQWIKPSSASEKLRQDRAERMIAEAMKAHPDFAGVAYKVYAKGSYPNNTNVRLDSDVDIVVENRECCYYEYFGDFTPPQHPAADAYTGSWTPERWRAEVVRAMTNRFGAADVDSSGKVAIVIAEKSGSRPSADVVPSFQFKRYDSPDQVLVNHGSKVFKTGGGSIVNWPQQQLDNGRLKNTRTGGRYKHYARALKNAENYLVAEGSISAKPSYLMECLAWNVPNMTLTGGNLDAGFRESLRWLWLHLDDFDNTEWTEPNELKYLFHASQKWEVSDAKQLILGVWNLLDYS